MPQATSADPGVPKSLCLPCTASCICCLILLGILACTVFSVMLMAADCTETTTAQIAGVHALGDANAQPTCATSLVFKDGDTTVNGDG